MNITRKILIGAIALFATTTTAFANSYRLDFAGLTSTGTYSGSVVLDYTAVDGDPSSSIAQYDGIVTAGLMTVNGIEYAFSGSSIVNTGFVYNDASGVGDYFGLGFTVTNTTSGEDEFFAIQFQQQDGSAFSTTMLPTSLNLTDFEPYDINNTNSTGAVVPIAGLTGTDEFFALSSATLTPVPLPAGLLLMLSALATLRGVSRKRSAG